MASVQIKSLEHGKVFVYTDDGGEVKLCNFSVNTSEKAINKIEDVYFEIEDVYFEIEDGMQQKRGDIFKLAYAIASFVRTKNDLFVKDITRGSGLLEQVKKAMGHQAPQEASAGGGFFEGFVNKFQRS